MRNLISNISNLSATGYGVNNILVKQIIDILEHTKSKTIRVLDFGCSKKPYKYLFDKYEHIEQYIGVDVYDGEYVDVVYDGDILPFEDEYFDLVFSSSVLEHVEDLDNSLYELARVTRGGGGVNIHSIPFINHIHASPYDFHRITYYGWMTKLKKYQFSNIDIRNSDSRYCCLMNISTAQINFVFIKIVKIILGILKKNNDSSSKSIMKGDASPENKNSKKLRYLYLLLKLNPINFLLGLSCFLSNFLPSNKDNEGSITSAYIIIAKK